MLINLVILLKIIAMARQAGPHFFVGTIGELVFYKMNGNYYVRKKGKVSKEKRKNSPRFSNSRRNSEWFSQASKKSSQFYRTVTRVQREVWMHRKMVSMAVKMIRSGGTEAEIDAKLAEMVDTWENMIEYGIQKQVA